MNVIVLNSLATLAVCVMFCTSAFAQVAESSLADTCGTERWSVKELSDAAASQINFTPMENTIGALVRLDTISPGTNEARRDEEKETYRVVCYGVRYKLEDDRDIHLVVCDTSDTTITMIVEIPDSLCTDALASAHVNDYAAARVTLDSMTEGRHPSSTFKTFTHRPTMVVTGVRFYDVPHGQSGKAPNNMELHPVIALAAYHAPSAVRGDLFYSFPTDIDLYPNPARDVVHIRAHNRQSVRIFTPLGRELSVAQGSQSLDLSSFPSGVFRVVVGSAERWVMHVR